MAKKEYKVPSKKQPIFKIVRKIFKILMFRNIKVTLLCDNLPNKCIMVSNHFGKKGPMAYEIAIPIFNIKWGTFEMLGNYKSRRNYLKNIFYIQKQGMGKRKAAFIATFEAIFSKMMYKGLKILGTYPDQRVRITIRNSIKVLEDDKAILIFPEDSNQGYFDVLTKFYSGFVILSEQYFKTHNEDLPIYPIYYSHILKRMVIGKPSYVQDLYKQGLNREEVAQYFCNEVNSLYYNYFEKDLKKVLNK